MANTPKVCLICKMSEGDEGDNIEFGGWRSLNGHDFHYFCVLMGRGLEQNGDDDDGISGFLWEDIRKSLTEWKVLKCYVCKGRSVSIQCADRRCRKGFHMICAMESKCLFEFCKDYDVYCPQHTEIVEKKPPHGPKTSCFICLEAMGVYHPITSIPSCCNNDSWYHRYCIQKAAMSSGLLLNCPTCGGNNEDFREFVRGRGIYVPDQDASWINPQNDLANEQTCTRCDANQCKCPYGRDCYKKSGKWSIKKCDICGANGIHIACYGKKSEYSCDVCKRALENSQENEEQSKEEEAKNSSDKVNRSGKKRKSSAEFEMVNTNVLAHKQKAILLKSEPRTWKDDPIEESERRKWREDRLQKFFEKFQSPRATK